MLVTGDADGIASNIIACSFGTTAPVLARVSVGAVECVSPAREAGAVQLDASVNLVDYAAAFDYVDVKQRWQTIDLAADSLAYTVCQVPVIHKRGDKPEIEIKMADGRTERIEGLVLNRAVSSTIFRRSHEVTQLTVIA